MRLSEARTAITAILAAIDDFDLPKGKRDKHKPDLYWFGGRGHYLGATHGDVRDPDVHVSMGVGDAFVAERMRRLDAKDIKKQERAAKEATS